LIEEAVRYSRMAVSLARHLRTPVDPDPEGTLRQLLQNRETNFLSLAKAVLADLEHPYSQLFRVAGCSYADLEKTVLADGVESALQALLKAGVYVSHDEFRGREEIVRGGKHIRSDPSSWMNRQATGAIGCSTSGSSGKPIATDGNSARTAHMEAHAHLVVRELESGIPAMVSIAPILPGYGIMSLLIFARANLGFERWFAIGGKSRQNRHYRAVTRFLVAEMRLMGTRAPYPTYLEPNDFLPAAEYLARRRSEGARLIVNGFVSSLSRVAAAAADHGLDLAGCRALCAGEALTPAKCATMESVGIQPYATYWTSEFGSLGPACRSMRSRNSVHISREAVALTMRPHELAGVDSICLTSLLPFAPRLAINVEIGDTGVIEPSTCDCSMRKLGFDLQIRDVAAIGHVTAQGMMIAADDLAKVLEEALPARLGGHAGDYQLVETESGLQTEMVLRVRPGAANVPLEEVLKAFLAETGRLYGGSLSVMSWSHSNGIRAEIGEPVLAGAGKFRAVRLLGSRTAAPRV
jgi:hypothetical protein